MNSVYTLHPSPLGMLALHAGDAGLRRLMIDVTAETAAQRFTDAQLLPDVTRHALLLQAVSALDQYFQGHLNSFALPLDLCSLTPFSRDVLHALCQIPFGTTCSYRDLAGCVGRPGAARAVGRVMASNPLPLIIPCHRVVPVSGGLGGYSGGQGSATKRWLLDFEQGVVHPSS